MEAGGVPARALRWRASPPNRSLSARPALADRSQAYVRRDRRGCGQLATSLRPIRAAAGSAAWGRTDRREASNCWLVATLELVALRHRSTELILFEQSASYWTGDLNAAVQDSSSFLSTSGVATTVIIGGYVELVSATTTSHRVPTR